MLSCCRAWPVKACMEIGTSCMLCARRCAVTVISSRASLPPSTVAARHLAPDRAPRTAAIAIESLEFIVHPLVMRIVGLAQALWPRRGLFLASNRPWSNLGLPYSVVRHPMYAAALAMLLGVPIALGSR